MVDLNVTKILVVLVVALLVLGPDKLPRVARQAAGLLNDVRRFRESFNAEVREAFGDPAAISALPTRGRAWAKSVTADALKVTSPIETSVSPPTDRSVGARPGSGEPLSSETVGAEPASKGPSGKPLSPGRAWDDGGDNEFDVTVN
jgi:Sec-independent protein translocase protein TatA